MLKAERQDYLLARLAMLGRVEAGTEARALDVSEDSIRRDLRELARAGRLQRVHGGAIPIADPPARYVARERGRAPAHDAIARRAAALLRDGQIVFFDGGTTVLRVAELLPRERRLTAVTHAPAVAIALLDHPRVDLHLAGGAVNKNAAVTAGADSVAFLRRFRADVAVLGLCALHSEIGLTIPTPDEWAAKRAFIEQSRRVAAVADASKLDRAFACVVGAAGDVTDLVTDGSDGPRRFDAYRALGITVHTDTTRGTVDRRR